VYIFVSSLMQKGEGEKLTRCRLYVERERKKEV
jgi:hypothetical protein